jgi:hypothetical protein
VAGFSGARSSPRIKRFRRRAACAVRPAGAAEGFTPPGLRRNGAWKRAMNGDLAGRRRFAFRVIRRDRAALCRFPLFVRFNGVSPHHSF